MQCILHIMDTFFHISPQKHALFLVILFCILSRHVVLALDCIWLFKNRETWYIKILSVLVLHVGTSLLQVVEPVAYSAQQETNSPFPKSSKLSPYLRFGCLSVKYLFHRMNQVYKEVSFGIKCALLSSALMVPTFQTLSNAWVRLQTCTCMVYKL